MSMVEWKKLGDVCEIKTGKLNVNAQDKDGKYPFFTCDMKPYRIDTYAFDCEALLLAGNGNIGSVKHYIGKFNAYQRTYVLINFSFIETRLLFHYLNSYFKPYIEAKLKKGSVPYITLPLLSAFQIPVPSIAEQQRIAEQLDTFTNSIENLKDQLALRRKQYEYYRDQLLDLEGKEGVEIKTLGEIGKCCAGATPSTKNREYWDNGTIPWMSSGEVHQKIVKHTESFITQKGYDNASTKILPINTIVIALAGQGKTRGSVAITAIELCTNQSICGVVIAQKNILNKYVYYYLQTRYDDLRRISSGEGTRGGLNLKMISSYEIPLPSLQEQNRIVSILDTFEESIQNLEKQLEQRQKQYEYYRNKLLTFE